MGNAKANPIPRAPRAVKPPRPRPAAFDAAYIEHGYDECELIFKASPATVKRWLLEAGRERLVKARAAFVAARKVAARAQQVRSQPERVQLADGIAVPDPVLRAAASHLRTMRNGGWFVAPTGKGDWWLGTGYRTPAQIVAFAVAKGFDETAARESARYPAPAEPEPRRRSWL